jgi:hypothetical protein
MLRRRQVTNAGHQQESEDETEGGDPPYNGFMDGMKDFRRED